MVGVRITLTHNVDDMNKYTISCLVIVIPFVFLGARCLALKPAPPAASAIRMSEYTEMR